MMIWSLDVFLSLFRKSIAVNDIIPKEFSKWMSMVKIPFIRVILELNGIQCSGLETQTCYKEESIKMFTLDFYAYIAFWKSLWSWLQNLRQWLWFTLREPSGSFIVESWGCKDSYFLFKSESELKASVNHDPPKHFPKCSCSKVMFQENRLAYLVEDNQGSTGFRKAAKLVMNGYF